jgi:hypothetical protein
VPAAGGSTEVSIGGLARSDAAGGFGAEFAELAELLRAGDGGTFAAAPVASQAAEDAAADADHEAADIADRDIADCDINNRDSAGDALAGAAEAETAGARPDRHEVALTRPDGE